MRWLSFFCALALLSLTRLPFAAGQYKNAAVAVDAGGWLVNRPDIVDADGALLAADKRPVRPANGLRFGLAMSFKMDSDRWWYTGRFNLGFLRFAENKNDDALHRAYDAAAADALGTLIGLEGALGLRFYFLTDRVRPYLQSSVSYMRLLTFSSSADAIASCDATSALYSLCNSNTSNTTNFLPHPNIGIFHVQPGLELIFQRDIALHLLLDFQRWIVINADDNLAIVVGLGLSFYS